MTARTINLGFIHVSNGRAGTLSRSWNRVYADFQLVRGNLALRFMPWVRIEEDEEDEEDDDNPDIEDYMGHYELGAYYNWNKQIFSAMVRNIEDSDGHYNAELQWSFPVKNRLRVLVQVYNGYGESMIDYNHKITRVGIGVLLTDWL